MRSAAIDRRLVELERLAAEVLKPALPDEFRAWVATLTDREIETALAMAEWLSGDRPHRGAIGPLQAQPRRRERRRW